MDEIHVAGHLSVNWTAWFEGLSLRHEPGREGGDEVAFNRYCRSKA